MRRIPLGDTAALERELRRALDRETAKATGANSPAVRKAGLVLRRHIRRVIGVHGTPHKPSAPGAPPHRIEGELWRSIRSQVVSGVRRVGSGFYRARLTEFGSTRAAPRPFMRAGLEAAEGEMMDVVVGELKARGQTQAGGDA